MPLREVSCSVVLSSPRLKQSLGWSVVPIPQELLFADLEEAVWRILERATRVG